MLGIFNRMTDLARDNIGKVTEAHLYESGLIVIEGVRANGDTYRMTLNPDFLGDKEKQYGD